MNDVVGIDEVGRGAWAGPVAAGAVLLGPDFPETVLLQLCDSKLLTRKVRSDLSTQIERYAAAWCVGWSTPSEVDTLGLTEAVRLAMQRALQGIKADFEEVIIDGSYNFLADDERTRTLIKADQTIPSVSAASIIAKVARDKLMAELGARFPVYGFEKHVGYGTHQHRQALALHGSTEHHRRSYKPIQRLI